MAKKDFKNNIESLFRDNDDQNENKEQQNNTETSLNINLDDITDEKLKWLVIKILRYEKELKLWRTGQLNASLFKESLKKNELFYDAETNQIKKID